MPFIVKPFDVTLVALCVTTIGSGTAAAHVLPFQVVPDAQLAVADRLASSSPLLYR